jgi:citrate synthase
MKSSKQAEQYLNLTDQRTDREYRLPITRNAIRATELAKITGPNPDDPGIMSYDPAFMNTASCISAITYVNGEKGILRYRGYPIEQLAGRVDFLDVAYLLIHGELPSATEAAGWARDVEAGSALPAAIEQLVETFPADAHPMSVLLAAWSGLSAYRTNSRLVEDPIRREAESPAFLGAIATLVGLVFRHRTGRPLAIDAPTGMAYATRLLAFLMPARPAGADPILARALDALLILQADHEQNCSTNAVRAVGSSHVDPYSAIAAGIAALYGPLHGGANEAVVRSLHEIGSVDRVPAYIESVKRGERKLMGFGHRIYRSYDPRARIVKEMAGRVFEVTGANPLLEVALAVESVALHDQYFIDRKLYPNVDFYSGLIYEAMGLPVDTYTTVFAVARMAGWVAQWLEAMADPEQKIARPRQIYLGLGERNLVR